MLKENHFTVNDITKITGISRRTLHYYDEIELSKDEQNEILKQHFDILTNKIQRLENIKSNLSRYLSGENLVVLELFQNSKIIPFKDQYEREGKLIYGETLKYKEYEASLSRLSIEEKEQYFASFDSRMKALFKLFAGHVDESPYSEVVQSIVRQWVDVFQGVFECDSEILACMAQNYKYDNRFKTYINQFSNIDLSDFIYKAIMFYCDEALD